MNNWKKEAKNFDDQYTDNTPLSWLPLLGAYVRNDLQLRQDMVLAFLGDVRGKRILDLGCGVGRISHLLASKGAYVTGYDISEDAINLAKHYREKQGLQDKCEFHCCDISEVSIPKADIWIALGLWQYLDAPEKTLKMLRDIPMFITDLPDRHHWIHPLRRIYRTYIKKIRFKAYSEADTKKLFSDCGFDGFSINNDNPTIFLVSRRAGDGAQAGGEPQLSGSR